MTSTFASQLQTIAKNSTKELNLAARRTAHAESLLFEPQVAAKQDFHTIYTICTDGFRELCQLDSRFHDFGQNLFSEQSQEQDREQMSRAENVALDTVLNRCLGLLGSKVLLKPGVKSLEWLVRRFRVHIYNVDTLLNTFLPYHELAVWANILSVIPDDRIVGQWKFLRPYVKTTWNVPRHAIAYAAVNNDAFYTSFNAYVLDVCREGSSHPALMKFWSSVIVEAIANRLTQTRSGRKEVEKQRTEDLLLKVLPVLSDAYEVSGSSDLLTTCYTITVILAVKADLSDHVLDSLLQAITQSLQRVDSDPVAAIVTMSLVAAQKENAILPKKVLDVLAKLGSFDNIVHTASKAHNMGSFLLAIVNSAMAHLKQKSAPVLISFAEIVLKISLDVLTRDRQAALLKPILEKILFLSSESSSKLVIRDRLVQLLQRIAESESFHDALALASEGRDQDALENVLSLTIDQISPVDAVSAVDTEMLDLDALEKSRDSHIAPLPMEVEERSLLKSRSSTLFDHIAQVFEVSSGSKSDLVTFDNLPLWSKSPLLKSTFFLRFALGRSVAQARARALNCLKQDMTQSNLQCPAVDVVHLICLLSEDSTIVRRAAAEAITTLRQSLDSSQMASEDSDSVYATNVGHKTPLTQLKQVLDEAVLPVLEECVLDSSYMIKSLQNIFNKETTAGVRKTHRQTLLNLLTAHAIATPLFKVKANVVDALRNVGRMHGKPINTILSPILYDWASLDEATARSLASQEGISGDQLSRTFIKLTSVHDKHVLQSFISGLTSDEKQSRSELLSILFNHIRSSWKKWKADEQTQMVELLYSQSFTSKEDLSLRSQTLLRSVDLPAQALQSILSHSKTISPQANGTPGRKRRQSSQGDSSREAALHGITGTIARVSFALELVDSNSPETKPELLSSLFEMLADLKQFKQGQLDSPYLTHLCLRDILAIVDHIRSIRGTVDLSNVRPELVTSCLQTSDNPQVQNTALSLAAALSVLIPDAMVHNIMPTFTFIGQNMISKDDQHSVNVINEAIDRIIPALVGSLRKAKQPQAFQQSMVNVIASFTSAVTHIPPHRRVTFYQRLLSRIGAQDLGYIVVVMLMVKKQDDPQVDKFLQDIVSQLSPQEQFASYYNMLTLTFDVLSRSPQLSATMFNIKRDTPKQERALYAELVLSAACSVLRSPTLASNIRQTRKQSSDALATLQALIDSVFRYTLTMIQSSKHEDIRVFTKAKQCLDNFLQLLPLPELLQAVHATIDDIEPELRPQALRVLAIQLGQKQARTAEVRELSFQLIDKLTSYLDDEQQDTPFLQAILVCIDKVTESYGRREPDRIISVALAVLEYSARMRTNSIKLTTNVQALIMVTISGIVEVLSEAAVPVVLQLLPHLLDILSSMKSTYNETVFEAACTLLTTVFAHVPFIVSEEQHVQILDHISLYEAEGRDQLITTMSRKVDFDILLTCLSKISTTMTAASVSLSILSQTIDNAAKSTVTRYADMLSQIFLVMLEQEARRLDGSDFRGSKSIEFGTSAQLKDTTIKFVYKLNDTIFRPIFESWLDWSSTDEPTKTSRQIVLFDLLTHFFSTLKAIVTSYTSYLIKPVSSILTASAHSGLSKSINLTALSHLLLRGTLDLLQTTTSNDLDSFHASPGHFTPLAEPLVSLLNLAATKSLRSLTASHVIPTITSLARSTMDTPSTHSVLASLIVKLRHAASPHVRLASVQTLRALTDAEDLGDEFVANTIGVGSLGEDEGARGGGGSVGELMIYVNEMLEDDDENVEREVRRWVQVIREKTGEDVFEV